VSAITPPFGVIVRSPDDALTPQLRRQLSQLARTPQLLVLCDYDGTISTLVDRPSDARPIPEAVAALRALALLPTTHVAVVSGRSLRDLAALSRLPNEIHLVGSHGGEFDLGFVDAMPAEAVALREQVVDEAYRIASGRNGVLVEVKPASVAVHVRMASREDAAIVLQAVHDGPARLPGVHVRKGHEVLELAVVPTSKGHALDALRHRLGASAALVVGDDVTDEDAFARASGPDIAIRVGNGETIAPFRVPSPPDVARILAFVLEERRSWLFGGRAVPIERHSMLADGRTVALLGPDATVTWLCTPMPDSPALFADLLGGPTAGSFTVGPSHGGKPIGQRYLPDTMTVETRWAGLTVHDELVLPEADDIGSTLVRTISGVGTVQLCFRPRPDFGRVYCRLEPSTDGEALLVLGSPDPLVLRSPGVRWTVTEDPDGATARATVDLLAGPVHCELRLGTGDDGAHPLPADERRGAVRDAGRTGSRRCTHPNWSGTSWSAARSC
jgi:trehalose-phosphatase